jgi:hypothetical protein
MNLAKLNGFETFCCDVDSIFSAGKSTQEPVYNEDLSADFAEAAVNGYYQVFAKSGASRLFTSLHEREAALAHVKLQLIQDKIDRGESLAGLKVGAWDLKFSR